MYNTISLELGLKINQLVKNTLKYYKFLDNFRYNSTISRVRNTIKYCSKEFGENVEHCANCVLSFFLENPLVFVGDYLHDLIPLPINILAINSLRYMNGLSLKGLEHY